jgi:hypothetical protein
MTQRQYKILFNHVFVLLESFNIIKLVAKLVFYDSKAFREML